MSRLGFLGKLNFSGKKITYDEDMKVEFHDEGMKIIEKVVNYDDFTKYCGNHYQSCVLNYCKLKLDLVMTKVRSSENQIREYISEKLINTMYYYNKKIIKKELHIASFDLDKYKELTENDKVEILNSTKNYIKKRFNKVNFRLSKKMFFKFANDFKEFGYNADKFNNYIKGTKIKYTVPKKYKDEFNKLSFNEAVKQVNKLLPDVTFKVSPNLINSLRKSRSQYESFINNPSGLRITKTSGTNRQKMEKLYSFFVDYYRFHSRYPINYYNFNIEPETLGFLEVSATPVYQTLYGRKWKTYFEEDLARGLIYQDVTDDMKTIYRFNTEIRNILKYVGNVTASGNGIGAGMFYALFYTRVISAIKESFTLKYIIIDSERQGMKDIEVQIVKKGRPYPSDQMIKLMSEKEKVTFNTDLARDGKPIFAYYMKKQIAEDFSLTQSASLHGFSNGNLYIAYRQVIPMSLDIFKKSGSLKRYFSSNDMQHITVPISRSQLGYFLKKLPENNFDFNTEDNYFCPLTALYKQGFEHYLTDEKIKDLYLDLGIFKRDDIRIYKHEIRDFYINIANILNINFIVRIYFIKNNKSSSTLYYIAGKEGRTAYSNSTKFGKAKKDLIDLKELEYVNSKFKGKWVPYTIACYGGHIFNTNVKGSLKFLTDLKYDELEDNVDIQDKMRKDIEMFKELHEQKIKDNKSYLLRNLSLYNGKNIKERIPAVYKPEETSLYYCYDYETTNIGNTYNNFITEHVDLSTEMLETNTIRDLSDVVPYSNQAMLFDPTIIGQHNWKENIVKDSLFTFTTEPRRNLIKFMNWMINTHIVDKIDNYRYYDKIMELEKDIEGPDFVIKDRSINCFIFAHNGAGFDNLITMYDLLRHVDMKKENPFVHVVLTPSKIEVSSKPLSFDYKIIVKYRRTFTKVTFSFRDSYRLLSVPVKNFPDTFGIDLIKLPYPYAYYQQEINKNHKKETFGNIKNWIEGQCDEELPLVRWSDLGIKDYKSIAEQGKFEYEFTGFNRSPKDFGLTDEFVLYSAYISCGMYDKITTSSEIIKSLENYRSKLADEDVMFDPYHYCAVYNYFDVYNLVIAMSVFSTTIKDISNICIPGKIDFKEAKRINLFQSRSISGVATQMCIHTSCYDRVVALEGDIQKYISVDKKGGKTKVNECNPSFKSVNFDKVESFIGQEVTEDKSKELLKLLTVDGGSLIDADFKSMYAAAGAKMGIPTGHPQPILGKTKLYELYVTNKAFWVTASWETKYHNDMPQNCVKEDGKNNWRNGKFSNIVIDDVQMRFMIESGEYTFDDFTFHKYGGYIGLYFEGFNYTISHFFTTLFLERERVRKENPVLGNTMKLINNSVFGSSILKEKEYKSKFVEHSEIKNMISRERSKMNSTLKSFGNYYEVYTHSRPVDHKIYPQFGARILSVSKTMLHTQSYAQSNIQEKIKYLKEHPDFEIPTTLPEIVKWTVQVAPQIDGKVHIKTDSLRYNDTDSASCDVNVLPFIEKFIGTGLGDLHSDYEFERTFLPLHRTVSNPTLIEKNMELSAIEAYFCAPKCYAARVLGVNTKNNKYEIRTHVRLKGVIKGEATFEDIKRLYNGEVLKYTHQSESSFRHIKGKGLGAVRDFITKEIKPNKLDTSLYYYAMGDSIVNGHYKFDERPIVRHSLSATRDSNVVRYYIYNPDDELEFFSYKYEDLLQ